MTLSHNIVYVNGELKITLAVCPTEEPNYRGRYTTEFFSSHYKGVNMKLLKFIKWIDEEELNEGHINQGQFSTAPKLYIEVCVSRIDRFISQDILKKHLNRDVRIRVRT